MSGPLGSSQWMYATDAGYSIGESLRFNNDDSAYLNRTPASSGNRRTWTFSCWFKRSNISIATNPTIISVNDSSSGQYVTINFNSTDNMYAQLAGGGATYYKLTNRAFRDTASWYHLVWKVDTTQSTASDRVKIYINGVEETSFSTDQDPALNSDTDVNHNHEHQIGNFIDYSRYFDGYLAEIYLIDGTALDADSFGEDNNGQWRPIEYSGSYGTNGFYLSFADSAAIGDDLSGNTNDWTANNLAASDVVSDSPTNSFCTLNPLTHGTYPTLKEGNLSIATAYSADLCGVTSTWYPTTGKWYWEVHAEGSTLTYPYLGITDQRYTNYNATTGSYYNIAWNRTGTAVSLSGFMGTITKENATSWTNDDIIMFALDVDARKLWIGKNGTWNDSGDPAAGTGENASWTVDTAVSPLWMGYQSQGVNSVFNFGQDGTFNGNQTAQGNADDNGVGDFYYSPPSGFLAMATSNIAEPAIGPNSTTTSDEHFNTVLWSGNSTSGRDIVTNHATDFVWIKSRSNATNNYLFDSIRGVNNQLLSNASSAESVVSSNRMTAFNTDGFEVGDFDETNGTGKTFVGWSWKAGGTAVSNTDGSVTSSVSANTDAGFSIVTYTGAGTGTVGHGLGITPSMYIVKCRSNAATNWRVYHKGIASDAETDYLTLDSTNAAGDATFWNDTAPTDDVFSVFNYDDTGTSGRTYVAYVFADVPGYLKAGSYVGNGNANGPTVAGLNFRPAWVMVKGAGNAYSWYIHDSTRDTFNHTDAELAANSSGAEYSAEGAGGGERSDFLSNGFKVRTSNVGWNQSGITYIYLAFAEMPFKYSVAR